MNGQRGAVVVLVALLMLVLIAFAGLAADSGYLVVQKNRLQNVADAAALACVVKNATSACGAYAGSTIDTPDNRNADIATVNLPASGNFSIETKYGNDSAICLDPSRQKNCALAIASATYDTFLMGVAGSSTVTLRASARAGNLATPNPYCILALGQTSDSIRSITISGGSVVSAKNCPVSSNADLTVSGSKSAITGASVVTYAGKSILSGGGSSSPPPTLSTVKADPYGSLAPPSGSSCSASTVCSGCSSSFVCSSGSCTFSPGTYCSGLSVKTGAQATFRPGLYVVSGSGKVLNIANNNTLASGNGVTFFVTNGASINISGGANVNLSAPTSSQVSATGGVLGMAFWQDTSVASTISGGSSTVVAGNLYLPDALLTISGGSSTTKPYGAIIARQLTISGGSTIYVSNAYGNPLDRTYPLLLQ